MGTLVCMLILASIGWNIYLQFSVSSQVDLVSPLPPADVFALFRSCFTDALHETAFETDTMRIRPRYKGGRAPSLSVSARPGQGGTEISIWLSRWTTRYGIKEHAQWAWRKRQRCVGKLKAAAAAKAASMPIGLATSATTGARSAASNGIALRGAAGRARSVAWPEPFQTEFRTWNERLGAQRDAAATRLTDDLLARVGEPPRLQIQQTQAASGSDRYSPVFLVSEARAYVEGIIAHICDEHSVRAGQASAEGDSVRVAQEAAAVQFWRDTNDFVLDRLG